MKQKKVIPVVKSENKTVTDIGKESRANQMNQTDPLEGGGLDQLEQIGRYPKPNTR